MNVKNIITGICFLMVTVDIPQVTNELPLNNAKCLVKTDLMFVGTKITCVALCLLTKGCRSVCYKGKYQI